MHLDIFEKQLKKSGFLSIAGVDEVGRGPLAGPVMAVACILPDPFLINGVNDSKKISPSKRKSIYEELIRCVSFGVGEASVEEIDQINIFQATLLAMQRAIAKIPQKPDYLLIDGNKLPSTSIPGKAVVGGDALCLSIGAASIIAKVIRDEIMENWDKKWPEYGFAKHKGYGTKEHLEALATWGPCPLHRRSFSPVKEWASLVR